MTQGLVKTEDSSIASGSSEQNGNASSPSSSCLGGVGPSNGGCGSASAEIGANLTDQLAPYQSAAAFQQYHWQNFYYQQFAAAAQPSPFGVSTASASALPSAAPLYQHWHNYGQSSKKGRQTYHRQQTSILEARFQQNSYVSKKQREELRNNTHLSDRQIKIWFQNRRMKAKKEKNRSDDQNSEHSTLIPANPPVKSAILTSGINTNELLLHNQQQQRNSPIATANNNGNISNLVSQLSDSGGIATTTPAIGLNSSSASAFSTSLITSSSSTPTSLMMADVNESYQQQLLNAHHQQLIGAIDHDKIKSCQSMAFGVFPTGSGNPHSMVPMHNSMNTNHINSNNAMMMMQPGNGIMNSGSAMANSTALGMGMGMGMGMTTMMMDPFFPHMLSQQLPPGTTTPMINQTAAAAANASSANIHPHYPYNIYPT